MSGQEFLPRMEPSVQPRLCPRAFPDRFHSISHGFHGKPDKYPLLSAPSQPTGEMVGAEIMDGRRYRRSLRR